VKVKVEKMNKTYFKKLKPDVELLIKIPQLVIAHSCIGFKGGYMFPLIGF